MRKLAILILTISVFACTQKEITFPEISEMYDLGSPIYLNENGQDIYLNGFFKNVDLIDSVTNSNLDLQISEDKNWIKVTPTNKSNPAENLNVWINGYPYSLVVLISKKVKHTFLFDAKNKKIDSVQLAGNFNSWTPSENFKVEENKWKYQVKLAPGKYHYQLVINGEWMLDPNNPDNESNNIGGFNSVLNIPDPSVNAPKLLTDTYTNKNISINVNGSLSSVIVLWDNYSIPYKLNGNKLKIQIPKNAAKLKRSYIRVWTSNKSGYSNDILVPLNYGKVISDTSEIDRSDKHAQVLYFMLVDRFNNGNTEIDNPVDDPDIALKANYLGGDIQGITKKVKDGYFNDLGVSMIWLSPITQNPLEGFVEYPAPHRKYSGYHGYWPVTLTTVDHRFGSSNDLHQLVNTTHNNDMNIILDFVSNHVHKQNKIYQEHPEWVTQLDLPDGTKNIRLWDEQRLTTWFDTFLPSLNFDLPEVINLVSDSAKYWIDNYNIDGFRHDATKHIPNNYWRTLTKKLRDNSNKDFIFQIGETFGSRELIRSYVGTDKLDGQFDFNLYFDMRNNLAQESEDFSKLSTSLQESLKYYGNHSLMGNITGNHDLPRFISYASGALKFDENDKEAGWNRDIEVKDTAGYDRLLQVTAFINTIPGIPVIYYGDEIGMPGAGDPDNRRMMKFENLSSNESKVLNETKQIIKLRRQNLELIYGDILILYSDNESMAYVRKYFNEISLIAFNKSSNNKSITIDIPGNTKNTEWIAHFGNTFEIKSTKQLEIELKPISFEILTNN